MEKLKGISIAYFDGHNLDEYVNKKYIKLIKHRYVDNYSGKYTSQAIWFSVRTYNKFMKEIGNKYLETKP